ncbi:MAG: FAD:protein FMN transferase [Eubacterium ventriosum]|uniref:FAD:protein FMN transferase n=1 Tax=Eubacterium ventriosum TaxID=39496 RepID=UPI001DC55406|nr:FAD:protein FMN transferase [Eubacterium ventriosum]MBD9055336.1 FAD:protein FMN transferase [Eubacterium ventriosum]
MKKIIILLICAILLCGCGNGHMVKSQKTTQNNEQKYTSELFAMDTYMEITAYGDNAKEAVAKASARINELDGMLSTGNSDSEVSKLNSEKELKLSEDVGNIMERSLEISESTGGVFNPAIYPIMQLWGFDTKNYKVPNKKELERTLKNINESKIKYDSKTRVAKLDKKMKIDFGGIAKGYTSSEVMKVFKDNGIKSGLVSLGGNVQALGAKPDGSKWKVAVQNPDSDESYIGVLEIAGKAVITSGGYERYFEKDGKTYHHIIDPATGYPADSGLKSVTIISSDGTLADGLSTSLFIMGIDKAEKYWRTNSDKFDAILLTNDNKQYVTEGIYSDYSTDYPVEKIKKENHNE